MNLLKCNNSENLWRDLSSDNQGSNYGLSGYQLLIFWSVKGLDVTVGRILFS